MTIPNSLMLNGIFNLSIENINDLKFKIFCNK